MIYLFSGTPGSGKSYMATRAAYETIHRLHPRPVIANYRLNFDDRHSEYFTYKSNDELTPQYLVDFSNRYFANNAFGEEKILLILDEIQIIANSRTWADKDRMTWIEFLSQHRHYGYQIIMIAQSDKMIDRQYRALIEYEVKHRKLANFGIIGKVMSMVALGRVYAQVTTYYGLKERIGVKFFVPRKKIFNLYNTLEILRSQDKSRLNSPATA